MTAVALFALWGVFLSLAVLSRAGRRDGLTPVQRWIVAHRLAYSAGFGCVVGAGVAVAAANPWFAFTGLIAAVGSWAALPHAEARLRRRSTM
ncbi:hypothetical protein JJV70_07275 [Streptomyces sp. JJ66]|uniref:hypothetical protein n=1 Tax=Streptomyces sp. JJ66 TaxID=2803843 RepID=UPI001C5828E4|nr:hypothetical protein [Streptomyces sp. JJ66]MBW1601914.1 hypothetical protein [Streptomyces sp. JJ66]